MAKAAGMPHEANKPVQQGQSAAVCNPGMKGCVLAGRFRFVDEQERPLPRKQARQHSDRADDKRSSGGNHPMTFIESLSTAWARNNSLLCVGLDPDPAKFPTHIQGATTTSSSSARRSSMPPPTLSAFKPQIAYFAARRAEEQLEALIAHIRVTHPGIPVILDAKRGDIGSTAEQYAVEAFERYCADAVTVNPMGRDSVEPSGLQGQGRDPALSHLEQAAATCNFSTSAA